MCRGGPTWTHPGEAAANCPLKRYLAAHLRQRALAAPGEGEQRQRRDRQPGRLDARAGASAARPDARDLRRRSARPIRRGAGGRGAVGRPAVDACPCPARGGSGRPARRARCRARPARSSPGTSLEIRPARWPAPARRDPASTRGATARSPPCRRAGPSSGSTRPGSRCCRRSSPGCPGRRACRRRCRRSWPGSPTGRR